MKKVIHASALVSVVLLLSACGQSEYENAIHEGTAALESKDYKSAIAQFQKATELEPDVAEPKVLVAEAESVYFDSLYEKGNEALTLLAFQEAKELFEKAYELDEVKQPDILDKKLKAEELDKKQKELNEYAKWVQKATKINNQISSSWRNASTDLSIGTLALSEFKEKMQQLVSNYQELLTSAEDEILNISGELSVVHTSYLNKMQTNYEKSRLIILSAGQEDIQVEELLTKGTELNSIQEQQALHTQALKSYAQTQGIVFNEK